MNFLEKIQMISIGQIKREHCDEIFRENISKIYIFAGFEGHTDKNEFPSKAFLLTF